jgi:hypothetical protein
LLNLGCIKLKLKIMIKKILFVMALISSGFLIGQDLILKDVNNLTIEGGTYYIYDNGANLAVTKFHVRNNSSAAITFDARVYELDNPTGKDLQICFGAACYLANAGSGAAQQFSDGAAIAPATGYYNDFKVAPFASSWTAGNYAKWRVVVVDAANAADSSGACIVWTLGGTFAGDQNANNFVDGSEIAGDVNGNGVIDGSEITGDMDGSGTIDVCEVSGDANGNGKIDNGEVLSVSELTEDDIDFDVYPNPATDNLTINYVIDGNANSARMDVYDVLGQQVASHVLNNSKGKINLSVNNLNAGVYFYSIKLDEKAIKTERVIVK